MGEEEGVLSCPGIPGAGKTMLSSIIINHIQENVGIEQDVGMHISSATISNNMSKLTGILASVLKQLVQALHFIPDDLNVLNTSCQRD